MNKWDLLIFFPSVEFASHGGHLHSLTWPSLWPPDHPCPYGMCYMFPAVNPIIYKNHISNILKTPPFWWFVDIFCFQFCRSIYQIASLVILLGMAKTRSMTRNQNRGTAPWSDLDHHLLFLVMMKLGVIDFLAFNGVCKSWRSLAVDNKKHFMSSKPPMLMSISDRPHKKECSLEDFELRTFKTLIPHSAGRTCVGLTCGYLIMFGKRSRDFWLVNPITRHQRHFSDFPHSINTNLERIRAILVFSSSRSVWVFVMIHRFTHKLWYSIAGTHAWYFVSCTNFFVDLHAFKGKIYTINEGWCVCELRLNSTPKLRLLEINNLPNPRFLTPEFVSLDDILFVMDHKLHDSYEVHELDFDEMKWVLCEKSDEEIAFFVNDLKYSAAVKPELWVDHCSEYERYAHFLADKSQDGGFFASHIWYFPSDCLNVNRVEE
ncbi:hypothetical protein LXL04_010471 [Taraxacum kok-saghyz]